jgi:hypothetical protein
MWFKCKCNSGYNPNASNPTPLKKSFQSALRADVSRAGEVFAPGSLTCIIFITMVTPILLQEMSGKFPQPDF